MTFYLQKLRVVSSDHAFNEQFKNENLFTSHWPCCQSNFCSTRSIWQRNGKQLWVSTPNIQYEGKIEIFFYKITNSWMWNFFFVFHLHFSNLNSFVLLFQKVGHQLWGWRFRKWLWGKHHWDLQSPSLPQWGVHQSTNHHRTYQWHRQRSQWKTWSSGSNHHWAQQKAWS